MDGLLGSSALDQEEARRQMMTMLGLGLLGIPKGQEALGIQRAGLLGMEARDRYLENSRRGRLADLQGQTMELGLQEKRRQFADADLLRQQQVNAPQLSSGQNRRDMAARFKAQGDYWANLGRNAEAESYYKRADALSEIKEQKVYTLGGKRTVFNVFKDGYMEPAGADPDAEKLHFVPQGDRVQGVDPFTAAPQGAPLPVNMSPAETAANARGWESIRRTDARAAEANRMLTGENVALGKGYQYERTPDGGYRGVVIPGGPADTSEKDQSRRDNALARADLVIKKVDDAIGKTGLSTAGPAGVILGRVPGTPAYDLRRQLDTVRANIGFQELQAMREASPTGGALGQVAVQELEMLQATLSSLDPGQSPAQLEAGLRQVRKHFDNWKKTVQQAKGAAPAGRVVDFNDLGK